MAFDQVYNLKEIISGPEVIPWSLFSLNEPPHIHVDGNGYSAKFWLRKVSLSDNQGFAKKELNELHKIVNEHQQHLLDQWHDYFGT